MGQIDLLVYTERVHPRISFVLTHIETVTSWRILAIDHLPSTTSSALIGYGTKRSTSWYMQDTGLLSDTDERGETVYREDLPTCFPTQHGDFPVDLFRFIFWMLCRVEEYYLTSQDSYGRISASQSWSGKNNVLDRPIVDLWIWKWAKEVRRSFPSLPAPVVRTAVQATFDIDYPRVWQWHPWPLKMKRLAGLLGRGQWSMIAGVMEGKDPFDSFDRIIKDSHLMRQKPLMFLLRHHTGYPEDYTISLTHPSYKRAIEQLSNVCELAWHPSLSSHKKGMAQIEWQKIQNELPGLSAKTRQHYLRITWPDTFRRMIQLGISDEYSLGYHDQSGFRAGTAHSYLWYDWKSEQQTQLRIHPLILMDASLRWHMKLSPDQAIDQIKKYLQEIKQVGGTFIWVWHNSSFHPAYGWGDWEKVYQFLLDSSMD